MAENSTGELRQCGDYVAAFYWTLPAEGLHLYTNIIQITISVLSALSGSIANVLVILSYFKNYRLRTLSNIPLLSLAFSDLLVTAVIQPLYIAKLVKETYGGHNCFSWIFWKLASYFLCGVSLLTVTLMSIACFITLAYPYRYQFIVTRMRLKIILANIWFIPLALVLSSLWLVTYQVFLGFCIVIVVVCLIVLVSIWTWIFRLQRSHKRKVFTEQTPSQTSKIGINSSQQRNKNTRTNGAIVTGLLVCYIPLALIFSKYSTKPQTYTGVYIVTPWGVLIVFLHSFYNPLLIVWRKSEFRQKFSKFSVRKEAAATDRIIQTIFISIFFGIEELNYDGASMGSRINTGRTSRKIHNFYTSFVFHGTSRFGPYKWKNVSCCVAWPVRVGYLYSSTRSICQIVRVDSTRTNGKCMIMLCWEIRWTVKTHSRWTWKISPSIKRTQRIGWNITMNVTHKTVYFSALNGFKLIRSWLLTNSTILRMCTQKYFIYNYNYLRQIALSIWTRIHYSFRALCKLLSRCLVIREHIIAYDKI